MKGPFSFWAFFGITLWIDIFTHILYPNNNTNKKIVYYKTKKSISVLVPVHKESFHFIEKTIKGLLIEEYPIKNIIIVGDIELKDRDLILEKIKYNKKVSYIQSPYISKAKKINFIVQKYPYILGDFVYIRDCRVMGNPDCIKKMMSYFNSNDIVAVTSYGRLSIPKNFLSRAYFYGKAWINEIGRFRKISQEKRNAIFVICGASTIFKKSILKKYPIPSTTKTEDTHYTWRLQEKGYKIKVANDAVVSAPDVDGKGFEGITSQIKQSYRWSAGTIQSLYTEGLRLNKNRKLLYTTIAPGFIESVMYSIPLVLLPLIFLLNKYWFFGFLIGDTVFSLLGTLILLPEKFTKTVFHYMQIFFFKYLNALIFLYAIFIVTFQAINFKTNNWSNEWTPPKTSL